MAAFSRPSLRSSFRQSASLDDVPPTDIQQNYGKHTREASGNLNHQPLKRQKVYGQEFSRSKTTDRTRLGKDFPAPTRKIAKHPVTQLETSGSPTCVPQIPIIPIPTIGSKHPIVVNNATVTKSAGSVKKIDKRILRSHDGGSRSRSELALYFPNYDELVSIEDKNPGMVLEKVQWLSIH